MPRSVTRDEIENHSNDVLRNKISCQLPACPDCSTAPDSFKRHEARRRKFRILCDTLIQVVLGLLVRWKCPGCNKTFTQQPPFALPYKRYTRDTILHFPAVYLDNDQTTYRKAVLEEGMPLFYDSRAAQDTIDDRALAPSTPYRWITSLGGFKEIPRRAQDLILQKNPASSLCRDLAALKICRQKYVKDARRWILQCCRQFLHVEAQYRATFSVSIFPFFATRCAWR